MAGKFNSSEVADLLARCHRRCCICHRFCGTKIETDHIVQPADRGDNSIDNAIAVCFECHAEIHSYNDAHPRGRKFRAEELSRHKEQWLEICRDRPEVFLAASWDRDVGPLQALIDELEYNVTVLECSDDDTNRGALFCDVQFQRAIREGCIAVLETGLKDSILKAYAAMSRASQHILAEANQTFQMEAEGLARNRAQTSIKSAGPLIKDAHSKLITFLGNDEDGN